MRTVRGLARQFQPLTRRLPERVVPRFELATMSTWTFMGCSGCDTPTLGGTVFFGVAGDSLLPSTRVVVGGLVYFGDERVNHFYSWDVNANHINVLADLPFFSSNDSFLAVHGSELVLISVYYNPGTNRTVPYDIGSDTWGADRTDYPENVLRPAACQDGGDLVYVISGFDGDNQLDGVNLNSYAYSLSGDSWSLLAPLDVGVWQASADVGADGKVYVMGGGTETNYPTSYTGVVRVYDPDSDTWDNRGAPPVPDGYPSTCAYLRPVVVALPDGKILFGGGNVIAPSMPTIYNGQFWIYDPDADTFTPTVPSDVQSTMTNAMLGFGDGIQAKDGATSYHLSEGWQTFGRFDYGG